MQARKQTVFRTIDAADFLVPEPQRRRAAAAEARRETIEDAVFEVVATGVHRARVNDNPRRGASSSSSPVILPVLTQIVVRMTAIIERQLLKLSPQGFMLLLGTVFLMVFWAFGGFSALSSSKVTAAPEASFSIRGTSFATEDANGMKVLVVRGQLVNDSETTRDAPLLKVVSVDGYTMFGTIVVPVDEIGPGAEIAFSSRFKLDGGKSGDIEIIPAEK
ncbi:hypothetical protein JJB09_22125 [Rhizobium sp. KVB221]|uniref:Uncharacterized protein n=1 Tax=Rhizobium setariae TaxID=2801340 RepID=A0A936YWJ7_9HYPH|nr:hypothetical protein [Rhizobium setariae]MBL0374715.1 hypothetical protein [Rhizobium setariae]